MPKTCVFGVFGVKNAAFEWESVANLVQNDAKLRPNDAKVVQKYAKLVPNDTILRLFLPPFLTQETRKMLKTQALKLGLFLASPVRGSLSLVRCIKGVSIISCTLKLGLFCIFLVHRLRRFH